MKTHFQLNDKEFEKQFSTCELNQELFNHEAHLRLAWIHINAYGIDRALTNIQSQLQNFVSFVGAKDKYNTTLTIVAVKIVYHFILKSKSHDFKGFIIEFPQLNNSFKEFIKAHYSFDIFNSEKAKMTFLEPDLLAFD
ncbi:hypothetical protein [uncultured Psychroserpens sp.]|uniref:hypothetical protein n=1 Tax=uncultured Psychroserpens sp. TaxID=255436 RepID=UPI00260E54A8|nr:hypothetical protein [uncultured Psychroserpens sp.]